MIAGHFGLAAGVKYPARQIPLWSLMLATVWLDIVFIPLLVTGVETIDDAPGTDGGYGDVIIHADYTHSLIGALVLAALFGAVAARWKGRRAGGVLGVVVFSHWLLDLIVHREDMPILPGDVGDLPRLGFGLWEAPAAAITVELLLVLGGAFLYWRAAKEVAEHSADVPTSRPVLIAGLILVFGLAVMGLDVLTA